MKINWDYDLDNRKKAGICAAAAGAAIAIWSVSYLCTSLIIHMFFK